MKIPDEIRAYNGKLNYRQLNDLIIIINNRANSQVNHGTGRIPLMYFQKEKKKRGFKQKKMLHWEREFLLQMQGEPDMTLNYLAELYLKDIKTRLKEITTWT